MTVETSGIYAVVHHKKAVIKISNAAAKNSVKYITYATSFLQTQSQQQLNNSKMTVGSSSRWGTA
jgi:hypothetical protein